MRLLPRSVTSRYTYGRDRSNVSTDIRRRLAHQEIPNYPGWRPGQAFRPTPDTTFLYREHEHRPAPDHGPPLGIVEAAGDAWDNALSGGHDETKGISGGVNEADEWLHR